ncbi:MAG: pseudouridine synthase [Verrucomicrobiaceae bacterium]|nr:pseudouridine synthase [Verrucomicrobiaceae bacterium]
MKLDRLIARHRFMGRNAALRAIGAGRVRVEGGVITDGHTEVSRFCTVLLDGEAVQAAERAMYLVMHKPAGWLSATKDPLQPTVLDLIDDPDKETLHIAGRLDKNTSGLLLLTNDGRWSNQLMSAESKVPKVYRVETHEVIPPEAVEAFEHGFYFHTEDITTLPAHLVILGSRLARVTLHEGRYHQVKRMFHRVGCRVAALHRESVGGLSLPGDLKPGAWRAMTPQEIDSAMRSAPHA